MCNWMTALHLKLTWHCKSTILYLKKKKNRSEMRKTFPHRLFTHRSRRRETLFLVDDHQTQKMTTSYSCLLCPESFSFMGDFGFPSLSHSLFSFSSPQHRNIKCYRIHNSVSKINFILQWSYFILSRETQTGQVNAQTLGERDQRGVGWVCRNPGKAAGFSVCGIR